jgi:hypothetical protein
VLCSKTPPDAIASFAGVIPPPGEWVVDGVCAYVPQVSLDFFSGNGIYICSFQSAWLRNASIKGKILALAFHKYRRLVLHREHLVQSSLR